jgi:hypothetical protein
MDRTTCGGCKLDGCGRVSPPLFILQAHKRACCPGERDVMCGVQYARRARKGTKEMKDIRHPRLRKSNPFSLVK